MHLLRTKQALLGLFILLILAGCSGDGQSRSGAAGAIEAYNQALVAKDADRLSTLSCADWEEDARTELESFGAVKTTLEDMRCQESGTEGDTTLVTCTGKISADYNGEILEINLADHTYRAKQEGGDWRMCGYRVGE
jgi:hypothetical protein